MDNITEEGHRITCIAENERGLVESSCIVRKDTGASKISVLKFVHLKFRIGNKRSRQQVPAPLRQTDRGRCYGERSRYPQGDRRLKPTRRHHLEGEWEHDLSKPVGIFFLTNLKEKKPFLSIHTIFIYEET